MPRLNARGDLCAGIGGATVSVWRITDPEPTAIVTNAGGAEWLYEDRAIFQHDAHLETFDVDTAEIAQIDEQGSYELAAGGGVYAAKFVDGVRVSNRPGVRLVGYGVGDVASDGSVLLKTPDGLFDGRLIEDIQAHGGASWSGLEGRRPVSSPDLPPAHVVSGSIYGFRRFGDFCCYLADDGARFIVQHLDRPVGKVIAVTPNAFRPDLVLTPEGLVVTYAEQVDEPPQKIRRFIVPVSDLTDDLTGPPPPTMQPPRIAVIAYDALLKAGEPWTFEFQNTGDGTRFLVTKDAKDRLWLEAQNAAGRDQTGTVRQLTVEGPTPTPEPEPAMLGRYWLQPNVGSRDLLEMFHRFDGFTNVDVFVLAIQNVLVDDPNGQVNDNTYPNLVAAAAFRQLATVGKPLVIEGGAVKDDSPAACTGEPFVAEVHTAAARVRDAGGEVAAFSMDEPITNSKKCHLSLEVLAQRVAAYVRACREEGALCGWLEAWPENSFDTIKQFAMLLKGLGALPDYLHPDVDHNRARNERQDVAKFIHDCQQLANELGITLGVFVNSTVDPIVNDETHYANLHQLARKLYTIHPTAEHVCVAAWARRGSTTGPQDVPANLTLYGLAESLADTYGVFEGAPLPEEPEVDPMLYKLADPVTHGVIRVKQLKSDDGHVTAILPDDSVASIQPDGSFETRPSGTAGEYEQCLVAGDLLLFEPKGNRWAYPYRLVK